MDYKVNFNFPDISDAIYFGKDFSEIRNLYIEKLRSSNNIYNIIYSNKLEECKNMMSSKNLEELESEFIDFKEHIRIWANSKSIRLTILRRQKDFIGLNKKIRLFLVQGKPLDRISDLLGFRIILLTGKKDTIESVNLCYELANEVIRFFAIDRHCTFMESEPIEKKQINSKNIIIPTKSKILAGFENNVKDYIYAPKPNEYQSLHLILRKLNGFTFEVQIRTFAMDLIAEHGKADHAGHKRRKYVDGQDMSYVQDILDIDYSKINIPGFAVAEDGTIHDLVGLTKSIDPLNFLG